MNDEDARVAIVTGAARGIGAEIAQRLARDGLSVAVLDLDDAACSGVVSTIRDSGGRAIAVGADVADEASVAQAVATVADALGAPTVLVNNAGIIRDDLIHKMSVDDWDLVMNVHLRGAFLMTRAVQAHMVAAGFGRIINLSSTSAVGNRGQANYSAAKAGVQGFTKTLAIELGSRGITANAIAPGFIATDMTAATAARLGLTFDELAERVLGTLAIRRAGRPEDIAHVASFFASEGAGYVTGQVIYVAGAPVV